MIPILKQLASVKGPTVPWSGVMFAPPGRRPVPTGPEKGPRKSTGRSEGCGGPFRESIHLHNYKSIYLSVCLSIYCIYLSVCLSIYLSIFHSIPFHSIPILSYPIYLLNLHVYLLSSYYLFAYVFAYSYTWKTIGVFDPGVAVKYSEMDPTSHDEIPWFSMHFEQRWKHRDF